MEKGEVFSLNKNIILKDRKLKYDYNHFTTTRHFNFLSSFYFEINLHDIHFLTNKFSNIVMQLLLWLK